MAYYRVRTLEVWEQEYVVEAVSEEEAHERVRKGEGLADETSFSYSRRLGEDDDPHTIREISASEYLSVSGF